MTKMFIVRRRETSQGTDESINGFVAMNRLDASAQKLQLQATILFDSAEVRDRLFELVRRLSLAKQALMVVDKGCLPEAFTADLEWVQAQARRTIESAAAAARYRLDESSPPLMVGFAPVYDVPRDDYSKQPPSSRIFSRFSRELARKAWVASGHEWGPTDITDLSIPRTLNPKVPAAQFAAQKETAEARARRTSAEIRRDKKAESYAIPFWQEVTAELDGTRGTSRVQLMDGAMFTLTIHITMQAKYPLRVAHVWKQGVADMLSPVIGAGTQDVFGRLTFAEVRADLPRWQEALIDRLTGPLKDSGYVIMSLHVLSMERVV